MTLDSEKSFKLRTIDEPEKIENPESKMAVKKVNKDALELINKIKGIKSLAADFTQQEQDLNPNKADKNKIKNIQNNILIKGKVKLNKPNKLLWEITAPSNERQLYVTNGSNFWHYDKSLEQVVVDKYDSKRINNSPFYFLLADIENITNEYEVIQIDADSYKLNKLSFNQNNKNINSDSNYTTELILKFTPKTNILSELNFVAAKNKKVIISLEQAKINIGLSEQVFNFKLPQGVDIINASELSE